MFNLFVPFADCRNSFLAVVLGEVFFFNLMIRKIERIPF